MKRKIHNFFKKIKNFLLNLFRIIKRLINKAWKSFAKLPTITKKIIYLWGSIILIFIVFIAIASINNNYLGKYETIEKKMSEGTLLYLKDKDIYATSTKPLKIDLNILLVEGFMYEDELVDKSCVGYSEAYYDGDKDDYVINSFINCKHYTTENYKK